MTGPLGWWLVRRHRRELARLRLPDQAAAARPLAQRVLGLVGSGCERGLAGAGRAAAERAAAALPWPLRPFLHEGHAVGAVGRRAVLFGRRPPPDLFRVPAYRDVRFLAPGLWNGLAERYPVRPSPAGERYWRGVESFPRYRLLPVNGYGFARVLLAGGLAAEVAAALRRRFAGSERVAAFHGAGRALWFTHMGSFAALGGAIGAQGDETEPLAVGLGLALAFTQAAQPEDVGRGIEQLPAALHRPLAGGAGIGLAIHARNDPDAASALAEGLPAWLAGRLGDALAAAAAADGSAATAEWYFYPPATGAGAGAGVSAAAVSRR